MSTENEDLEKQKAEIEENAAPAIIVDEDGELVGIEEE